MKSIAVYIQNKISHFTSSTLYFLSVFVCYIICICLPCCIFLDYIFLTIFSHLSSSSLRSKLSLKAGWRLRLGVLFKHDEVLIYVKFVQKALFQGRLGVTLAIQFSIDMTLVQQIKSFNDIYSFNQVHAFFHCFLRNCEKYLTRLKFVKKLWKILDHAKCRVKCEQM